ncbi:hypothetical protein TrVFT333_008643 [Trichoderma virens FT-333]|nr:hypothetical protein TrVFT333_008643 [Trichoderma virens FT-333]
MDAQFQNAEQASRLKTSLDLSDGDHFDQVIAISQGMINHAIKRIHEQNEDMNDFYGDSDSGSISADLAPSELVIPVGDPAAQKNNIVIWRTNIKQGTLTVNYRDVPPKDYTIDNWTIDVKVPLTWEKFEDAPDDDDAKKNRKKKQRDFIHNNFEVPGDYRPERLYAKMASGWWGEGVSFAGPSSMADKSSDEYATWKEVKENDHASSTLESIFKDISLKREEDGMTTIGTRFNLDGKIPEHDATYAPTSMIHQSFPYRIGSESGKTGWESGIRGTGDPGSRNCLLYCENVDNRPMTWRELPQTGNFTTIGNPNSPGSRVDGSFVLSHQLIFEKFLLPKLQVFVKESQIYPGPAHIDLNGDHSYGLDIGVNPSKDPYGDPNNPIYRFRAVGYGDAHYEAYVESTYDSPYSTWRTRMP